MKIAFLNIYTGIVERGAEIFVKEVSSRLGKEHEMVVYSAAGKISEEKARSQTPFTFFGKILYKFYLDSHSRRVLFFTISALLQILKKDYDWVIPVDGGWQLLILKFLQKFPPPLGLRRTSKILVSGQAGVGRDDLRNLRIGPDVFVALTRRAYEWAKTVNPQVKVVHIPNGVDLKKFNPDITPAKIDLERPIVLCVAGLNPYKRVDLTIKAVASLKKGSFLLIGDGPQKDYINGLGKKLLGAERFLQMTVSHDELPSYYVAADLFTMVSESSEAFGIVYVEAMASGLTVVATGDETRREIVGEAGFFVDPTNIDKYAKTLKQALETDFGNRPRQQAQKFSWDKIAKEYEKVMRDMLK